MDRGEDQLLLGCCILGCRLLRCLRLTLRRLGCLLLRELGHPAHGVGGWRGWRVTHDGRIRVEGCLRVHWREKTTGDGWGQQG